MRGWSWWLACVALSACSIIDLPAPVDPQACVTAEDCPGSDGPCVLRTCEAGRCGQSITPAETVLESQLLGDCQERACDGAGNVVVVLSSSDVFDDGNACTKDSCDGEIPVNSVQLGKTCSDGGVTCSGNGSCVACLQTRDCIDCTSLSGCVCEGGACISLDCTDGALDGAETDVDCGGAECLPCADGAACGVGVDCVSGVCDDQSCAEATCADGVANGDETDLDCGGPDVNCERCADGNKCDNPDGSDCQSGVCFMGECQAPRCFDGVLNGDESDVDCGESCPKQCLKGQSCNSDGDCAVSLVCVNSLCYQPGDADTP